MIKIPAATAMIAMTLPNPEKLRLSNGTRPVKISQTANNRFPTFFVIFINKLLSVDTKYQSRLNYVISAQTDSYSC